MASHSSDTDPVILSESGPGLPALYRRVALDEVPSTNDEALGLAAGGAEEGTLVTARRQTRGRGRRGRRWHSPEGNLHLSLVLRPPGGAGAAVAIAFAAALAVAESIEDLLPDADPVEVKWPNDVLLGGRKAAGVLVEAAPPDGAAVVLGVGVNLASAPAGTPYPATALARPGAPPPAVEEALAVFCRRFLDRYNRWRKEGFAPLRRDWLGRARGLGQPLAVDVEGRRFDGTFTGIDEDGALCLDLGAGGVKKITAGDVGVPDGIGTAPC